MIRSAAGGVAEKVLLGIESQGMDKDIDQINESLPDLEVRTKEPADRDLAAVAAERAA